MNELYELLAYGVPIAFLLFLNIYQMLESNRVHREWCKMTDASKELLDKDTNEREQIIAICNRHAQPGVNGQTHEVCYRILQILGEREVSK